MVSRPPTWGRRHLQCIVALSPPTFEATALDTAPTGDMKNLSIVTEVPF